MNRRHFIKTTGASLGALLVSEHLSAFSGAQAPLIHLPDEVTAIVNDQPVTLKSSDKKVWQHDNLELRLRQSAKSIAVEIAAPQCSLSAVTLHWKRPGKPASLLLNDQWERTYGDISWHKPQAEETLPWYFMEYNGSSTSGFGVKTGARAFCSWRVNDSELQLTLDTRSGGNGVQLGNRKLAAAEIVTIKSRAGESAFATTRRFTGIMCDRSRTPKEPVYGINDWYFSYGRNSEQLIEQHTALLAPMAEGLKNRPFSVVDAGWYQGPPDSPDDVGWGDRLDQVNARFGDMRRMADRIRQLGMRPGIWTRPLCGSHKDPKSLMLPLIKGRRDTRPVLDPTIPENLERVKSYFKLYNEWGYEMVKFDFTSYDIFGKWGFEMLKAGRMTEPGWRMQDNTRTNAEIISGLYEVIREAAGDTYIIGCNTISHLSAGVFELCRIGDDTSGNEWDRTRKMGVNTVAFRGLQQGTFYGADGDCVGLTTKIPWAKNKQWMELVAKSGTPLFISAQPEATGTEQKAFIRDCFKWASEPLPVGEPLDWMENAFPEKWKLMGKVVEFDWK
jgi:alpha-galactosidase